MEDTKTESGAAQEPMESTPEVKRSTFPTVGDILAMLGIFLVAYMIAVYATIAFGAFTVENTESSEVMGKFLFFSSLIVNTLTFVGIIYFRKVRGGSGPVARFSMRGFNPMLILWGFVLILAVGIVLEPLLNLLPPPPLEQFETGIWTMLAVVFVAPVFEELICRGVVLESIRSRYGVLLAWLISSLFFGVIHFQAQQSMNAFFIGLILAFLYLRADSIWIAMILHALNNAVGYLMILMNINPSTTLMTLIDNRTLYGMVYFAAAVLCAVSGVAVWRTLKMLDHERKNRAEA